MKLNKKLSHGNLDGMLKLTLMIYGRNMKKYLLKFMLDNLRITIVNQTKNRFLQQAKKIELINWN